jgi:hypothetical protein
MKKLLSVVTLIVFALVISPAALADTFSYDFTTQNSSMFGNGVLTVVGTQIAPGEFLIGSGSITLFGNSAPGTPSGTSGTLIPITENSGSANSYYPGAVLSPSGSIYYDNLLYSSSNQLLDAAGLLFNVAGTEFNIFSNGSPTSEGLGYSVYDNNGLAATGNFNVVSEMSPVPEPTSLTLLGTGLLAAAGVARRRFLRV